MMFYLFSMSAMAGYECKFTLFHSHDIDQAIAKATASVETRRFSKGDLGSLFVESETRRKTISIDINAFMSGWANGEEATFIMMRRETSKRSQKTQIISDKLIMKGNEKQTFWFDSYKLDISCKAN